MRALKSVEEAGGLLRISKWTVRDYIKKGKLRPIRIGRRVLIDEGELERFVAECQRSAKPQRLAIDPGAEKNTETAI